MRNIIVSFFSILAFILAPFSFASSDSFESQVFYQSQNETSSQFKELSQEEMKATEGAMAHFVYGLMAAGRVAYVGITNNLARRATQHAATKSFDSVKKFGTYNTRTQARIAEQNLINKHNTINNGLNKINSISPKNPLSKQVTVPYRK